MRPDFIPQDKFRAFLNQGQLSKLARVGGIMAGSYVERCERNGRPIAHRLVNGARGWRMLDVVARACANGDAVTPTDHVQTVRDIDDLRAERAMLAADVARLRDDFERVRHAADHPNTSARIAISL